MVTKTSTDITVHHTSGRHVMITVRGEGWDKKIIDAAEQNAVIFEIPAEDCRHSYVGHVIMLANVERFETQVRSYELDSPR